MAYIERESAIKSLLNDCLGQVSYSREDAADCIFWLDTADVAPVRHGRWIAPFYQMAAICVLNVVIVIKSEYLTIIVPLVEQLWI